MLTVQYGQLSPNSPYKPNLRNGATSLGIFAKIRIFIMNIPSLSKSVQLVYFEYFWNSGNWVIYGKFNFSDILIKR